MKQERVIELAKQAGFPLLGPSRTEAAVRFAQLVRNETLEEAALQCVSVATAPSNVVLSVGITCAEKIRSLKS